ncbi:helix-turn-helix domain-containing protein [Streptomyces sp. MCAF7]
MAARRGTTFRRRELGKELRRLRERTGITILEAAKGLGFSEAKLSRVETGNNSLPRVADMEALLDRYGITDIDDRETLLTLHRDSLTRDWWTPYRNVMPSGRQDDPLELRVILDESALRRVIGGPEIMREQYEAIAELCSLDNVTVQVLPQPLATYRASDNFIVLDFDGGLDSVVVLDTRTNSYTDKKDEIWAHNRRFDAMREGALPPTETPRFLKELARELV